MRHFPPYNTVKGKNTLSTVIHSLKIVGSLRHHRRQIHTQTETDTRLLALLVCLLALDCFLTLPGLPVGLALACQPGLPSLPTTYYLTSGLRTDLRNTGAGPVSPPPRGVRCIPRVILKICYWGIAEVSMINIFVLV